MNIPTPAKGMRLGELLEGVASDAAAPDLFVTDMTLDSRATTPGALFIALPGARKHGIEFAPQAAANGASVILWEPADGVRVPPLEGRASVIGVPRLRNALGALADRFFGAPSAAMSIAAVTGTNGKTTSAYLIAAAFAELGVRAGYAGTLGYGHIDRLQPSAHTTADCITVHRQLAEMRGAGDSYVGMEVSSHALDQGRIDGVRVHSALFTNLTRDHLDYHGTLEAYGAAKERLFQRQELRHCAINVDDEFGRLMLGRLQARAGHPSVTAFSAKRLQAGIGDRQLFARKVDLLAHGLQIEFDGSWGVGHIRSPLIGAFNVENLLGVLATILGLDVSVDRAVAALALCRPPPGRMETLVSNNRPTVVIDYAHTPDALEKALATARAHTKGKVICVFGCGGDRDGGKRPLMGEIAEQRADIVVVTDDNPRTEDGGAIVTDILQGMSRPQAAIVQRDRAQAIAQAIALGTANDLVLVAGKGHEDYQIVGRDVRHFSDREVAGKLLGLRS